MTGRSLTSSRWVTRSSAIAIAAVFVAVPFALPAMRLPLLLLPTLVGAFIAWLFLRRSPHRWIVAVWAWCGLFGTLNAVNYCSSGWCRVSGFPLPYLRWTDAVVMFNGRAPDTFYELSLAFDVVVFAVVTLALMKWTRHAAA